MKKENVEKESEFFSGFNFLLFQIPQNPNFSSLRVFCIHENHMVFQLL